MQGDAGRASAGQGSARQCGMSRYAHVARTYVGPLPFKLWAAGTIVYVGWSLAIGRVDYGEQLALFMLGGTLAGMFGAFVAAHAKEQLADARARLTPGFRTPHLVVAAAVLLAGTVGLIAFTLWRHAMLPGERGWPQVQVSPVGFAAIVLAAAAALMWMSQLQSAPVVFAIILGGALTLVTPGGRSFAADVFAGKRAGEAIGLLTLAVAGLVALWWRLAVMHEEMREYFRQEGFNRIGGRPAMTGDRSLRRAAAAETDRFNEWLRGAGRLERVTNISNAGFWQRVRHWRLVIGHGYLGPLMAAVLVVVMGIGYAVASPLSKEMALGLFIVLPTALSLTLPIAVSAAFWPQRWYALPMESLRPALSRRRLMLEHGTAMAWELGSVWAWLTACAFAGTLFVRPDWLLSQQAACTLLICAASQVFLFAVCVWVLRLRLGMSVNFLILVLAVAFVGYVARVVESEAPKSLRAPSPLWAAVLVAMGVVIALDAYRRWLKTDLD